MTRGDRPVWFEADRYDVDAVMNHVGACVVCKRERVAQMVHAIKGRDAELDLELSRKVTFWVDGQVWVVGEGVKRARFRPARFDDLLRYMPRLSLPHPESDGWKEFGKMGPEIIEQIWGRLWLLPEEERDWNRRFLSRAFDESQRIGPFFLGWPSTAKNVFQGCLGAMLPRGGAETISGQDLDQYAAADLMSAVIVFIDDAQQVPGSGWAMAKSRSGKGSGRVRAMRQSSHSKESESSLMVFAEVAKMGFTKLFERGDGWDNRLAYQVFDKLTEPVKETSSFRDEMRSESNLRDLAMWIIDGDNGVEHEKTKRTGLMAEFAKEVWAAAEVTGEDGQDLPTPIRDMNGEARVQVSDESVGAMSEGDFERRNLEKLANVMSSQRSANKGVLPPISVLLVAAREAGVTTSRGKRLQDGTARRLVKEVQADAELSELSMAEDLL